MDYRKSKAIIATREYLEIYGRILKLVSEEEKKRLRNSLGDGLRATFNVAYNFGFEEKQRKFFTTDEVTRMFDRED